MNPVAMESPSGAGSHLQTLIVCKLGFNQNFCTFTLIVLMKIVMCSEFA